MDCRGPDCIHISATNYIIHISSCCRLFAALNGEQQSPREAHNPDRFKEEAEAAQRLSDLCLQRRLQHLRVALEELTGERDF